MDEFDKVFKTFKKVLQILTLKNLNLKVEE